MSQRWRVQNPPGGSRRSRLSIDSVRIISYRNSRVAAQFLTFVWVGGVTTSLQYLILILLVQYADCRPAFASGVGYAAGAGLSYFLNRRFTFETDRGHVQAVTRFMLVAAVGLVLNSTIVAIATEKLGPNYLFGQVLATGLVLLWNFSANRLWTFGSIK